MRKLEREKMKEWVRSGRLFLRVEEWRKEAERDWEDVSPTRVKDGIMEPEEGRG